MEAVHLLLRSQLISMPQYDLHLAQMMNNGLHYMAVAFAMQLIQRLFVDDKQAASHVTEVTGGAGVGVAGGTSGVVGF